MVGARSGAGNKSNDRQKRNHAAFVSSAYGNFSAFTNFKIVSRNRNLLAGLTPGVIRISLTQLAREAVCFLGFASLPICQGGFVECARSYGRIIVKQGHSLKRFAGVIEI